MYCLLEQLVVDKTAAGAAGVVAAAAVPVAASVATAVAAAVAPVAVPAAPAADAVAAPAAAAPVRLAPTSVGVRRRPPHARLNRYPRTRCGGLFLYRVYAPGP